MGMFDDAVPGGNIAKPVLIALGTLLVGRMLSGGSSQTQAPSPMPNTTPQPQPQMQQGGGVIGGLGGLLDRLTSAGHGDAVNSWVGPGQNVPIPPNNLGTALGQTTVSDLARSAGISEQELLAQLSRVLPGVVDKLTPDGRVPSNAEIAASFSR
jgi:uncharacterized protein YidB (DUF937 family)